MFLRECGCFVARFCILGSSGGARDVMLSVFQKWLICSTEGSVCSGFAILNKYGCLTRLTAELRSRYEPTQGQLFAGLKDDEARKRSRQQVAEDMLAVIVQLIVGAIPETAVAYDGDALAPMLEQLQEQGWLPEELLADTAYGSDANMQLADALKVDLIAPTCGRAPQASADEMTLDEIGRASCRERVLQVV